MTKKVLLENLDQLPTVLQQLLYLIDIVSELSELSGCKLMTATEGKELAEAIFNE